MIVFVVVVFFMSQETFNYAEEENVGSGGSTSGGSTSGHPLLHDSESKALPVSCIAINKQ